MAIDTAAKRFSAMNFVSGSSLHLSPMMVPAGAVNRTHGLDLYLGIALGSPVAVTEKNLRRHRMNAIRRSGLYIGALALWLVGKAA